jgi:nucleotide-binding universal stress UspA family protein
MTAQDIVLVGTDGSTNADAAVRWAATEAQRRNATLRVVHAYDESWASVHYLPHQSVTEVARNHAEEIVANAELIARAVAPGLPVHRDAVIGEPATTLLDAATSAAVVVVGNRGRGGFTSLLLGSVGQRVATHAPSPAVVVRGRTEAVDGPVVVGADGSASGSHALQLAFEEAAARGASLIAIRAYMPPVQPWEPDMPTFLYEPAERDATEHATLDGLLASLRDKFPQVPVEALVSRHNAAGVLVGVSHTAQLVVVGSRGFGSVSGTILGSVSLQLLHHADCPVMIARS